VEQSNNIRV